MKFMSFVYAPEDQLFRASDTGNLGGTEFTKRGIEMGVCKVKMREKTSPRKKTLEDFQTQFVL
jgi:hypothetical protein